MEQYAYATQNQTRSIEGLMEASAAATPALIVQNEAMQAGAAASGAAAAGMNLFSAAAGMVAVAAATAAISSIAKGIDNYIHRNELAIARTKELQQSIDTINAGFSSRTKLVQETASVYDALIEKGVNTASNENLNLSTEEYQTFLNITNRLAEAFPQLKQALDENGNAILSLGTHGKSASEDLQELLRAEQKLNNFKISQELPDLFQGTLAQMKEAQADSVYSLLDDSTEPYFQYLIPCNPFRLSYENNRIA